MVLVGPGGDVTLVWREGEDPAQRVRGLPAGTYRLRTARGVGVHDGQRWFASTSGPGGAEVSLEAGAAARLAWEPRVVFKGQARRERHALRLGFGITGPDGRGLSVFRGESRVPVTYRVLDAEGAELYAGPMRYG